MQTLVRKINVYNVDVTDHSLTPRFAELERMGAIQTVGERDCAVTNRQVLIWDVTAEVPRRLSEIKLPTKKDLIRALCDQVEEMASYLATKPDLPEKWVIWRNQGRSLLDQCAKYRKETKH